MQREGQRPFQDLALVGSGQGSQGAEPALRHPRVTRSLMPTALRSCRGPAPGLLRHHLPAAWDSAAFSVVEFVLHDEVLGRAGWEAEFGVEIPLEILGKNWPWDIATFMGHRSKKIGAGRPWTDCLVRE